MRKTLHNTIFLVIIIIILISASFTSCGACKGLHSENANRNNNTRWRIQYDKGDHVVK